MNKNSRPHSDLTAALALEPRTLPGVAPAAGLGLLPTLAVEFAPIEPPSTMAGALRQRLLARAAQSAAANLGLTTRRLADAVWQDLAPGVRVCGQHKDELSQSSLIQLAPGTRWAPGAGAGALHGPDAAVHEILVLSGELRLDVAALGTPTLAAQDYQLIGLANPWPADSSLSSTTGALLYWRSSKAGLSDDLADLAANEFGQTAASHRVVADAQGWQPLRQGVEIKPLHMVGERISMLVRFQPGATVPAHPHELGEECLMLEGDLFLSDVLLRAGEFQFAPAGTGHEGLLSDVGCLLYFCGAIDPAAADPEMRAGY
ncbi:cupin domain-containing protein [Paucibacter sp. B2R-40]|uniref:cupin domain-containing protein n=1 Tax=Paucibacter sp. B2R-40 TaxID=2893554 RepID=UPI0021E37310|nr:cupin domain-containing protein [Paucibacter sp. B2R-40]MCV2353066.1 cupin domain-containing protein [Paucibacter sp. B2R-40]